MFLLNLYQNLLPVSQSASLTHNSYAFWLDEAGSFHDVKPRSQIDNVHLFKIDMVYLCQHLYSE